MSCVDSAPRFRGFVKGCLLVMLSKGIVAKVSELPWWKNPGIDFDPRHEVLGSSRVVDGLDRIVRIAGDRCEVKSRRISCCKQDVLWALAQRYLGS